MSSTISLLSEEQFCCSLCLELFTQPVSVPCGHSFCLACIHDHWLSLHTCSCPRCSTVFPGQPDLPENPFAREMSEEIRARRQNGGGGAVLGPGEVACDVCTGSKLRALKSCLVCLTSYCESHLEPHHRVAGLKIHQLVRPVENLEDRMCRKHQRLLEMFCRSDQTSVCVLCAETDHRGHHTVPAERESAEKKVHMERTEVEVQQMIQNRLKKVEEIKHSVELSRISSRKAMEEGAELFSALLTAVERSLAEVTQEMVEKQRAAERRAEDLVRDLEREILELRRRSSELEKLSHTEDHFWILQKFPSVSRPPPTRDWSDTSLPSHQCVGAVRVKVSQLEGMLKAAQTKLARKEHEIVQEYAVDVCLDPHTANPWLVVSEDRKQVWDGDREQENLPEGPRRFDTAPCVLAMHGFTCGRRYWEVEVSDKTAWDLGVARESVNRKGVVTLSPEDGYWTICLRKGSDYRACDWQSLLLPIREKPWIVGVLLDYEEGVVSFYDAGKASHIYSFIGCSFAGRVFPLFNPDMSDSGDNKSALVIRPVAPGVEDRGGTFDDVTI